MRDLTEALWLLRDLEGFRAHPYLDAADVVTIGYGHVVYGLAGAFHGADGLARAELIFPHGITVDEADDLLRRDVTPAAIAVEQAVTVPLTVGQWTALVCFAYNEGVRAFRRSTLLERLNAGDYAAVPNELRKWVFVNGVRVDGLAHRREREITMWATPDTPATTEV